MSASRASPIQENYFRFPSGGMKRRLRSGVGPRSTVGRRRAVAPEYSRTIDCALRRWCATTGYTIGTRPQPTAGASMADVQRPEKSRSWAARDSRPRCAISPNCATQQDARARRRHIEITNHTGNVWRVYGLETCRVSDRNRSERVPLTRV